jgi:predicted RNase H-like nuclease (RuvC/YqgF family)
VTTPEQAIEAIRETAKRARGEASDLVNEARIDEELHQAAITASTDRLATLAGDRPSLHAKAVRYVGRVTRINDAQRALNFHLAKGVQLLEFRSRRQQRELESLRAALASERAERELLAERVARLEGPDGAGR